MKYKTQIEPMEGFGTGRVGIACVDGGTALTEVLERSRWEGYQRWKISIENRHTLIERLKTFGPFQRQR